MTAKRHATRVFVWSGALVFVISLGIFLYQYFVAFGRPAPPGPRLPAALFNTGLFTVFALHHSILARSSAKAVMARAVPPALERSVYTWTASILFIAVCVLWRPLPGELYNLEGPFAIVGYAIQIVGISLTAVGSSTLGALDLAGLGAVLDRDDRRNDAALVPLRTTGLYGFVRHPLYFAWVLIVFGTPHMTLTRVLFAVVSTTYLAVAIPFEERGLIGVFGDEYRRYRTQVRWRMLPGLY